MNLIETTPPAAEPLTLEDAKAHLRITHDADDDVINALIRAARAMCESDTGLALITRGYSLYLDAWEDGIISLPRPPLVGVSGVNVYDAEGNAAVFPAASYTVDTAGRPGRVALTVAPPLPGRSLSGIEIEFTAGFGDTPEDVPQNLREGMKRLVAYLYMNRGDAEEEAVLHSGAALLFRPFRVLRVS